MNVFFLIPAALVAVPVVIMAQNVWEVRDWRRVSGVVISTRLVRMTHKGSAAESQRPVIEYRYTVEGTEYRSDVYTHGMLSGGSRSWAQRIIDRYPPGQPLTVLHHPTQPERACLTASFGFFGWVLAVLCLLLLLLAVIL